MKKRKFVGFMTVLGGVPGLFGIVILLNGLGELSFLVFMAILAVLCRGLCGVVGGILIWRGSKLGYQLSAVMWCYMVVVGLMAFYQLFTGPYFTSFEFSTENQVFWSAFGKSAGKLLWGIPFLYLILKDLVFLNSSGSESDHPQRS